VEGSDTAGRVTRNGRGSTFATLCGRTGERRHWLVRTVTHVGSNHVIFIKAVGSRKPVA